jgi:hypothetical protein
MTSGTASVRWHSLRGTMAVLLLLLPLPAAAGNLYVDCGGGSAGAYPSISAALAAAVANPLVGDTFILLKGNCTENVAISGGVHRVWIAPEWDSCPWSGCTTNGQPAQITAANPGQPVVTVTGASDVTLVHLTLTGGSAGLSITGASVTAYGVSADGNSNGIQVDSGGSLSISEGSASHNKSSGVVVSSGSNAVIVGQLPWLQGKPFVISGNGYAGLFVDRSAVTSWAGLQIVDNKAPGILAYTGEIVLGAQCCGQPVLISGNDVGAYLSEKARGVFYGDTTIRENRARGVYVEKNSHAGLTGIVVEGHTENGVDVVTGSQASFRGRSRIRGNGAAATPWSAGIRIDGSSNGAFDEGADTAGPPVIAGNTGAGILVDLGSSIDLRAASVSGNSGEGVRLRRGSTAVIASVAAVRPNGAGPISCDRSSTAFGDRLRRSYACWNVEPEGDPRPARPIAGQ